MLYIALATLTWIPPLLGYGSLLGYGGDPALRRAATGMLGLGAFAALGTVVHFLLPLNPAVSVVAWLAGAGLFWRRRHWLAEGATRWELAGAAVSLVAFILLMQPPWRLYDAGLYYYQAVRWVSEQRIEVGLVNLHGRLAFNSTWFVVSALLQHPLAAGASAFFVTLLPLTFAAAAATGAIGRLVAGDRSYPNYAAALMLLPVVHATEGLGAHALDQALTVLVPFTLVIWSHALDREEDFAPNAQAALILSAFALTVKLSTAPLLAGGAAIVLASRREVTRAWLARVSLLASLAILPWLARSVLLSGCFLYPVAATCVEGLRWTPAAAAVHAEAEWIYSWARQQNAPPEQVLGNWNWLKTWCGETLSRLDYLSLFIFILAGSASVLAARRSISRSFVYPYAIAVGGVLFWFFSAPDPRFALGFLFALGLFPASLALSRLPLRSAHSRAMVSVGLLAGAVWLVHASGVFRMAARRPWPIPAVAWPATPVANSVSMITSGGYVLSVPATGDQCWNNPLPCSPSRDINIGRDWAIVDAGQLEPAVTAPR